MKDGDWARRDRSGTFYHLVQSTINDVGLTKCGKYLQPEDAAGRGIAVWVSPDGVPPYMERAAAMVDLPRACIVCTP